MGKAATNGCWLAGSLAALSDIEASSGLRCAVRHIMNRDRSDEARASSGRVASLIRRAGVMRGQSEVK